jgi:uncharacterized membrane protein
VRLSADAPPGWRVEARPSSLTTLAVGADASVVLLVMPDGAATPGDYEARLRVEGGAGERPVESEPRVVRVRVLPAGRSWSGWLVAAVLVAIVALMVRAGRRLVGR